MFTNKRRIITVLLVLIAYSLILLLFTTFFTADVEDTIYTGLLSASDERVRTDSEGILFSTEPPVQESGSNDASSTSVESIQQIPLQETSPSSVESVQQVLPAEIISEELPPQVEEFPVESISSQPTQIAQLPEKDVIISAPVVTKEPFVEPEPLAESRELEELPFVEEDDDFWADFYVAGDEDTSLFEGGAYYVPFYVNDEYVTDITVFFENDELFIDLPELEATIGDAVIPKVNTALFDTEDENISLQTLNDLGIEGYYDYQKFELYVYFPTWMLPKRVLSINRTGLTRYSMYQMSGTTTLERPWFSMHSNLSLYSSLSWDTTRPFAINWPSIATLQSQSSFNLFDVAFDFSFLVHPGRGYNSTSDTWSNSLDDYVTFSGIQGFYDFTDSSVRFTFGNVNDYLGLSKERIGLGIEKQYNYGKVKPNNHQYNSEITLEEASIVEVFINEKSVYRRELLPGIYEIKDFAFEQGVNIGRIEIIPLDNPEGKREVIFDIDYDSRLMAKGDRLYALGISTPINDLLSPSFRITQSAGISHEFTASYDLNTNLQAFTLGLNLIYASPIGTLAGNINTSLNSSLGFGYSFNSGYSFPNKKENPLIGNFSFSFSFASASFTQSITSFGTALGASLDGNFGFSGRIGDSFRYSISTGVGWLTHLTDISLRSALSMGLSLIPNLGITGSLNVGKQPGSNATITYQIGGNYTFGKNLTISASSDLTTSTYISGSFKPFNSENDNIRFNMSGLKFSDLLDHQGGIYYSHIGRAYALSVSQQYSSRFTRFTTSLTLSTAVAYADGLFGIARNISDNFLLVRPKGAMKNQKIAVTRTMTTDPERLPSLFGTSIYTGLSSHSENNLVIYGIGDELLSSSESFIFDLSTKPRQGFAVRVSSELAFSVVGNILKSPSSAYESYSAELAKVVIDEDGLETLLIDETLYLFTDENGFYFISGLSEGEYQFSIFLPNTLEDEPPVDIRFSIRPEGEDENLVYVLDTFIASEVQEVLDQEAFEKLLGNSVEDPLLGEKGIYRLNIIDKMNEIEFWDSYYPKRLVLESITVNESAPSDAIVQIVNQESGSKESALVVMIQKDPAQVQQLTRLRRVIKPFIEATIPKQFELSGDILKPVI